MEALKILDLLLPQFSTGYTTINGILIEPLRSLHINYVEDALESRNWNCEGP